MKFFKRFLKEKNTEVKVLFLFKRSESFFSFSFFLSDSTKYMHQLIFQNNAKSQDTCLNTQSRTEIYG